MSYEGYANDVLILERIDGLFPFWREIQPDMLKVKRRFYKCLRAEEQDHPPNADFYYAISGAYQYNEKYIVCKEWCKYSDKCKLRKNSLTFFK